jgi:hypothetical protein
MHVSKRGGGVLVDPSVYRYECLVLYQLECFLTAINLLNTRGNATKYLTVRN